jgi:hypothetical protein
MTKSQERLLAFIFGAVFVIALIALAIVFPSPTAFQYTVFRIVLALAVAGVASMISGFLEITLSPWLRAGGALAVFSIVYFYSPAQMIAPSGALQIKADARGPQFLPPTVNSGRTLDACIDSPEFPSIAGLQCVHSAQKIIAMEFCVAAQYRLVKDFSTVSTSQFQMSVKFHKSGASNYWTEDNTGGTIFNSITCE